MKKVISLLSVCAVLLGMAACSNDVFEDEFVDKSSGAQTTERLRPHRKHPLWLTS